MTSLLQRLRSYCNLAVKMLCCSLTRFFVSAYEVVQKEQVGHWKDLDRQMLHGCSAAAQCRSVVHLVCVEVPNTHAECGQACYSASTLVDVVLHSQASSFARQVASNSCSPPPSELHLFPSALDRCFWYRAWKQKKRGRVVGVDHAPVETMQNPSFLRSTRHQTKE